MAGHRYAWIAVAALGMGVSASAAPMPGTKLDMVERAASDTVSIKAGTTADNVGDVMTFTNPIYDAANVKKIGSDQGYCVRMVVGKLWECHWTTMLAEGQIMVDGPVADTGDTLLAVTGGTGAFMATRGEMTIHPRDAKATAYDFHFHLN